MMTQTDARLVAGGATMSNPTFFVQGCPTCGRRLQIRVEYLGKRVVCDHCRGRFIARDPANCGEGVDANDALMRRAEQLLESVTRAGSQYRTLRPR
jgi:hypothetical protein